MRRKRPPLRCRKQGPGLQPWQSVALELTFRIDRVSSHCHTPVWRTQSTRQLIL